MNKQDTFILDTLLECKLIVSHLLTDNDYTKSYDQLETRLKDINKSIKLLTNPNLNIKLS
jgi:hypothetical protein